MASLRPANQKKQKQSPPSLKSERTLIYDIETAANVGLYFGPAYEVNIGKVVQQEYVMGFAWKYLGERRVHSCYVWDFPRYKREPLNDIEVIKKWVELMGEADIIVGHNSDQFDNKVMVGRMIKHRLKPIALPQSVDTKKAIKRVARFNSNKLDDLGEIFGIGRKMKHSGIELWWACMTGDPKAQRKMVAYNKQDVILTEDLYLVELPYMASHPNRANIEGRPDICPKCGGSEGFLAQGFRTTKTARFRRFQCKGCWSYISERQSIKEEKVKYV